MRIFQKQLTIVLVNSLDCTSVIINAAAREPSPAINPRPLERAV